jgi:hypothetical protein
MSRSKQSSETAERLARLAAEDRAVTYLEKFSPHVAFATALMAEAFLAEKWSVEQSKMMQRGDTRKVYEISANNFERMRKAREFVPPDVEVDLIGMQRVIALLAGFPSDVGWMAASTVAWRMGVRALLGPRQKFDDFLPDLLASVQASKTSD